MSNYLAQRTTHACVPVPQFQTQENPTFTKNPRKKEEQAHTAEIDSPFGTESYIID
jgi:hypothetical protein